MVGYVLDMVPREEYVVTTDVTTSRNKGVCVTLMEHVRRHALTRGVQRGLRIITCVLSMVRRSLRDTNKVSSFTYYSLIIFHTMIKFFRGGEEAVFLRGV
jgi:hypothetical protein